MGVGCDRGQLHAYCECRGWHLWEPAAQLKLEEVTPGRSALWGGQGRWSGGQERGAAAAGYTDTDQ